MENKTIIGIFSGIFGAFIIIYVIIQTLSNACEQAIRASGGNIDEIAWHCQVLLPRLVKSLTS